MPRPEGRGRGPLRFGLRAEEPELLDSRCRSLGCTSQVWAPWLMRVTELELLPVFLGITYRLQDSRQADGPVCMSCVCIRYIEKTNKKKTGGEKKKKKAVADPSVIFDVIGVLLSTFYFLASTKLCPYYFLQMFYLIIFLSFFLD